MANAKLSGLTIETTIDRAADYIEIYDASAVASRRATPNAILGGITGAPIGTTDTQTLTNKTITAPAISSPVLSGTVTGTYTLGGTPTFPSAVATLTGTQTLTNKTLTSPTINSPTITNPTLTVDNISEFTSANGVSIDGVLLKDSNLDGSYLTAATVSSAKINFGGSGAGVWWEEIARTTLASAGDIITVSSIPARKYLQIIMTGIATGGTLDTGITFNGDTGANYSAGSFNNGAAYTSGGSQPNLALEAGTTASGGVQLILKEILNIATSEKIINSSAVNVGTTGAATAPKSYWSVEKWANTSVQISSMIWTNTGTGDFAIGSEIIILGHN